MKGLDANELAVMAEIITPAPRYATPWEDAVANRLWKRGLVEISPTEDPDLHVARATPMGRLIYHAMIDFDLGT